MKLQPKLKFEMILKSKWDIDAKNDFWNEILHLNRYDDIWNGFDFWSEYDILISIMNRFEM